MHKDPEVRRIYLRDWARRKRAKNPEWAKNKSKSDYEKAKLKREQTLSEQPTKRVCNKCRMEKPTATDFYPKADGYYMTSCKSCQAERGRAYAKLHPEKLALQAKKWRARNPERHKEISRRSSKKNGPAISKRYRATEHGKQKMREQWRLRRAREKGGRVPESKLVTTKWFNQVCENQNHKCAYCDFTGVLQMEHVIPLTRGGKHIRENIIGACLSCNSSKNNKLVSEWRPWLSIATYGLDLATA